MLQFFTFYACNCAHVLRLALNTPCDRRQGGWRCSCSSTAPPTFPSACSHDAVQQRVEQRLGEVSCAFGCIDHAAARASGGARGRLQRSAGCRRGKRRPSAVESPQQSVTSPSTAGATSSFSPKHHLVPGQNKNVARHTSRVTRHTSHVTRHTSHVTRHTSHVTHHTSHITRHTSHFTRHTSHVTHAAACSPPPPQRRGCCTSRLHPTISSAMRARWNAVRVS